MTKKTKTAPLLSSNKDNLKKNATLLPVKPVNSEPVKPVNEPVKPVNEPVKPEESSPEISALVDQIKATGVLKNVFCNGFDFILARTKKSRLSVDEKVILEDPLNKLEVKFLEMLPEYIRKQADKGGPIIDLTAAVIMIVWAKNQEAKALKDKTPAPVKPEEKPLEAVNPPQEKVVNLGQ